MKKGKLLVIEGTDCSGKETQSKLLQENLKKQGYMVHEMQFPRYDTPTGKIVGGAYLGKDYICPSYFPEGAANVNAKVASLYYAADRLYNKHEIEEYLDKGYVVILDRYVESNMAHQGGKIKDSVKQEEMFDFLEKLEFDMLELPRPDAVIFLHMPYESACILKKNRNEAPDGHEVSEEHLRYAEKTYLRLVDKYGFKSIECANNENIKTIEEISKEVLALALEVING